MVVRTKLDVKGFSEYLEKIARSGRDIDPITDRALDAGGQVLLGGMQRRVPKDTRNLEGHLEIEGPLQDGNFHYIFVGLSRRSDAETARYGNAQEFGTANMAAQPYIRPTLDADMGKAKKAMKEVFEEEEVL